MASLIVVTLLLRRSGLLGDAVNVEHYHDLGKLLFGWIVFWSYIAFAQFFLTWYSNIPDEVAFFHQRWHDNGGTWKGVSLALVAMHFFVPFWFLMSRNIKRRLPLLAAGARVHDRDARRRGVLGRDAELRPARAELRRPRVLWSASSASTSRRCSAAWRTTRSSPWATRASSRALEFENA